MFTRKSNTVTGLNEAIDALHLAMADSLPYSPEYSDMTDQLIKLYTLRDTVSSKGVSPDTLALIFGNLAGIFVIVGYEQAHVVTSKALTLLKTR